MEYRPHQLCPDAVAEKARPGNMPIRAARRGRPLGGDCVEKLENRADEKTRQIEIQRHIGVRHHLSPAADLARCLDAKLAVPPANFLTTASVGLPRIEHHRKESFSTQSGKPCRPMAVTRMTVLWP